MKKFMTSVLFLAFVFVIISFDFSGNIQAQSIQDYEQKIKELDQEQNKLKNKQSGVQKDKQSVDNKMDENKEEQRSVTEQMEVIEQKLSQTETDIQSVEQAITATENDIDDLEEEIAVLNDEIAELEERIERREVLLKNRLRSIQESGGSVQYISVLLGAESFGELISRSSAVNSIMDQDKNIMESHFADKQALQVKEREVQKKKVSVEEKKAKQEKQKKSLQGLKTQLDEQKAEKEKIKEKLEEEYEELEEYSLSLEEENRIIANHSSALEKAKQMAETEIAQMEEAKRQAEAAKGSGNNGGTDSGGVNPGGGGLFAWPTSGNISSYFGPRTSPGGIGSTYHNGIDFSAPRGTTVVSAASGAVKYVNTGCVEGNYSCGGGYGNYIIVTHYIDGQVFDTLYAHLSSVNVSVGQTVSRGQAIGGVGHTGSSTGPHLHYEIHPGGYKNPANPMQYY